MHNRQRRGQGSSRAAIPHRVLEPHAPTDVSDSTQGKAWPADEVTVSKDMRTLVVGLFKTLNHERHKTLENK
ncbi:hypothetical protein SV7mr_36610 [Stieleria bergensis]|uniref:Uncharacterized protein n=1 Tax=Stieleria bergensis TaxID=2528025 RepID=A0A517SYA1_9BACT|nr:hypothetical protein SV7mr_36610 [Planctomycetes bacterium SV_7m_r]